MAAGDLAPTIVDGSKKHGGADLDPSDTRAAWRALGVNGSSIADAAPDRDFVVCHGSRSRWWRGCRLP